VKLSGLRKRLGFRGTFLFLLGLFDVFYGWYLLAGGRLQFPPFIPERAWGLVWLAVAAVLVAGAFAERDWWAYGLGTTLKVAWAMEFFRIEYVHGGMQWTRAAYFLALGLIVVLVSRWPEPKLVRGL
jgi:hypothetical protein